MNYGTAFNIAMRLIPAILQAVMYFLSNGMHKKSVAYKVTDAVEAALVALTTDETLVAEMKRQTNKKARKQ